MGTNYLGKNGLAGIRMWAERDFRPAAESTGAPSRLTRAGRRDGAMSGGGVVGRPEAVGQVDDIGFVGAR
ncbi:MAG: hypothetical protein V1249_03780, partial [Acidimicrobiales bacterium]|nr:hypothetical protein [Acidimicrobiales bacterium]